MDQSPTASQTDRRISVTDRDTRNSSSGFVSMDTEENIASPTISTQVKVREWRREKALCCRSHLGMSIKQKITFHFCRFRDVVYCRVLKFHTKRFSSEI